MNWIQTYTGQKFNLMEPDPETVNIEDIAHALSMQCRFNGHLVPFYSIAEHCWHMSYQVSAALAVHALMHDASEAYVCDVPRPLKDILQPAYGEREDAVQKAIYKAFSLPGRTPEERAVIKVADDRMLITERNQLFGPSPHTYHWEVKMPPYDLKLRALRPEIAEELFLGRWAQLYEPPKNAQLPIL